MSVRHDESQTTSTDDHQVPLSGGLRLIAFAITAGLLMVVVIVTRSAQAVGVVVPALLLLLVWLSTGKMTGSGRS